MIGRFVPAFLGLAMLSLSGCVVGDSIAHLVKLTQDGEQNNGAAPSAAPTEEPAAVRPNNQREPAAPAAAPVGPVQVETLTPPPRP
jgi:hypothetical protein